MNTMSSHMSNFYIGQISSMARTFTEKDVRNCLELTREDNTVYFNDTFMQNANLKGKVIPGILSEGLIMEVSSKKLPGTPGLLLQKEVVFHHPVYIGDTITASIEVIDIDNKRCWLTLMVRCVNQVGKEVITGQIIAFIIPNHNG